MPYLFFVLLSDRGVFDISAPASWPKLDTGIWVVATGTSQVDKMVSSADTFITEQNDAIETPAAERLNASGDADECNWEAVAEVMSVTSDDTSGIASATAAAGRSGRHGTRRNII